MARYGETTWGHWLAELLPRALAAERALPGHFIFAVPSFSSMDKYEATLRRNALASLEYYGIGADRLLSLWPSSLYRFASLTAVTSAWTKPMMMHPDVVDLMRNADGEPSDFPDRVLLMRDPVSGRTVMNEKVIIAAAERRGYIPITLATLSFADQVRCFAGASKIVSVLGSDLAGVLYAPDGVGVLSLAPGNWGDRFFYALMQLRDARCADLRGSTAGPGLLHRMPFTVDLTSFEVALERVG